MVVRMFTARSLLIITSLLLLIGLVACGQAPAPGAVTAVSIDQDDRTIAVGGSFALSATVTAAGGAAETVTWTSSDEAVATVSSAGVVEAVGVGDTTITATSTFDPSRSDTIQITTDLPGSELWTHQFGTSEYEYPSGVAVDAAGNVIVVGDTDGDYGGPNKGDSDAFVTKIGSSGTPLWKHQFGTDVWDFASGVAVDSAGDIIIAGVTDGDLDGPSAGNADAFVVKLGSDGSPVWTRQFGTTENDYVYDVAVDSDDNILVAGYTSGVLGDSSAGLADVFVTKFDSAGNRVWTHQFGSSDQDYAYGVAVDSNDSILVVGYTGGNLGGPNAGGSDVFVRKIEADGTPDWTHQFGSGAADNAVAVALDSDDNILVAGYTAGNLGSPNAGGQDAFVTKINNGGAPVWTHQFGTSAGDYAYGVAVDSEDNVLIAGYTAGDLEGSSAGMEDAFVVKTDSAGSAVWMQQFGTSEWEDAAGVAVDPDDRIVIVGSTYGLLGDASAGDSDVFVRKHLP